MASEPQDTPNAPVEIGRAIDEKPWSGYQTWVVALVALAVVMDGLDNRLLPLAIPVLLKEWAVTRDAFALATSCGLLGMVLGTMAGGRPSSAACCSLASPRWPTGSSTISRR